MDWFHCNHCFTRGGSKFAVSSCGHICCEACITSKQCSMCGGSCSYLPITDEMKPEEKVFFKDPLKLIQSRLEHISQIALFQQAQMERVTAHFKHKSVQLEKHLQEVTEQYYRKLSELKRENSGLKKKLSELEKETAELKKPLSQRRVSPGQFQIDGSQRMSLPVAVTSPVTPRSRTMRHLGSAELLGYPRERGPTLSSFTDMLSPSTDEDYEMWVKCPKEASKWNKLVSNNNQDLRPSLTPGSATSISSHSSFHDRTPTSFSTPSRTQRQTPNVFQFQFMSGLSIQSPRR